MRKARPRFLLLPACALLSACTLVTDLSGLAGGAFPCDGGCNDDRLDTGVDARLDSEIPDGMTNDRVAPPITIVQSVALGKATAVTIQPTMAGNLVVVGITQGTDPMAAVSVTDDAPSGGNAYVMAGPRSVATTCVNLAEIWYAKNVVAGATTVRVTYGAGVLAEIWVMEIAGLDKSSPLEIAEGEDNRPGTGQVDAPRVTTSGRGFVISTAACCKGINDVVVGSPFTALTRLNGNDSAFAVTTKAGSYGASWTAESAPWNAVTAAFR